MRVWIALSLSTLACAQIETPKLGLLPDGGHVRQIYGIPPAASVSDAIADHGLHVAAVSQDYAVAIAMRDGAVTIIAPKRMPRRIHGALPSPDRIAISPSGSAAALWYISTGHAQIVSGLPLAPTVRDIDASFLGALRTIAVSDDGSWLAGAWDAGVYSFNSEGSAVPLQAASDVAALAFFPASSDLAMATSARIFTLKNLDANPEIATVYEHSMSPVGIAASATNIVVADSSGVVYGIDTAKGGLAILDCDCQPEGVFPLAGPAFRLTSPDHGLVKLFDTTASMIQVVPVPHAVDQVAPALAPADAPLPALSIGGLPGTSTAGQQLPMTISIASAFTQDISGTATLAFQSASSGDDQTIQFGTGGRTVAFTIPAGSTQATFAGKSSVVILTGTVAGSIVITANVTSSTTPPPAATATVTIPRSSPTLSSVTLTQTSGGLTVVVTGYTSSREVSSGAFSFSAGSGATLSQTTFTVPLAAAFSGWFGNSTSTATGGQFTLTVPFTVQGNASNVVRVGVDLTNQAGVSNVISSQ